jgi:hypothetical protein
MMMMIIAITSRSCALLERPPVVQALENFSALYGT